MKKLAILVHGIGKGDGVSTVITSHIEWLMSKYDIYMIIAQPTSRQAQYEYFYNTLGEDHLFFCGTINSPSLFLNYIKNLYNVLKTNKFDCLHSHMNYFSGINLLIARLCGVKVRVSHSHASKSCAELKNKKSFMLLPRMFHFVMRQLIKTNSTHMFGCSSDACRYMFGEGFRKNKKCSVLLNPIQDRKPFTEAEKSEFIQNENIDKDMHNILILCRLSPEKNIEDIIKISEIIINRDKSYRFHIVGTGPLKEKIENLIEEKHLREYIKMYGYRSDRFGFIETCDLMLLKSDFEGLPMSIIEAELNGMDCIVSNTITRDVDFGRAIYMEPKADCSEWADAIEKYFKEDKKRELDYSKAQKASKEAITERLYEIYG